MGGCGFLNQLFIVIADKGGAGVKTLIIAAVIRTYIAPMTKLRLFSHVNQS